MDPLSLVAGVTGLILFVKEVKQLSSNLYQTVKKKPQFLQAIAEDLDALQSVLEELEHMDQIPHEGLTQEQNALSKVLFSCNRTVTEINGRLVTLQQIFTKKMVSRLMSYKKFDTELKEIVNLRDELAAIKATLNLALHLRAM
jgi:Na+/phosphate symporter